MGVHIVTNKKIKEEVVMTFPFHEGTITPQKIDLLDLLDHKTWLPKDSKASRRHVITLLDIMDPPGPILDRKVPKNEITKKDETMNLVNLLDRKTWLPKNDGGETERRRRIGLLDVMDTPVVAKENGDAKKKPMNLVDFLDSKTRLPKKMEGEDLVRRRIGLADVMDPTSPVSSVKHKEPRVDLVGLLDPRTRLPRDSRGLSRRHINILDILESDKKQ
jgi:hypothetical protein